MDREKTIEAHFDITGGDLRLKNVVISVSKLCSIANTTAVSSLVRWYVHKIVLNVKRQKRYF
jgi:hypothetical protein